MTKMRPHIALMQAQTLPAVNDAQVPDWIHLLPAGEGGQISTGDTRGPYRLAPAEQIIATSMAEGAKLPIDENHAIDLAAPRGEPAPARGWIVELQSRQDGIWGRVEWTETGRRLMEDRAYLGISPAVSHDQGKTITGILRASLVNRPNLRGLTALHQETEMEFLTALADALGLQAGASQDDVLASIRSRLSAPAPEAVALQSALAQVGVALGVAEDADSATILAAAQSRPGESATIVALQSELAGVTTQLNTLTTANQRRDAETYVDGEIAKRRVGIKPARDHYIALHMQDPTRARAMIEAAPILGPSGALETPPAHGSEISLNAAQRDAARLLGITQEAYAATLKAERANEEHL